MNEGLFARFRDFVESSRRIFAVAKKPTKEEWLQKIKITFFAVLLVGIIGYLISLVVRLI